MLDVHLTESSRKVCGYSDRSEAHMRITTVTSLLSKSERLKTIRAVEGKCSFVIFMFRRSQLMGCRLHEGYGCGRDLAAEARAP